MGGHGLATVLFELGVHRGNGQVYWQLVMHRPRAIRQDPGQVSWLLTSPACRPAPRQPLRSCPSGPHHLFMLPACLLMAVELEPPSSN